MRVRVRADLMRTRTRSHPTAAPRTALESR